MKELKIEDYLHLYYHSKGELTTQDDVVCDGRVGTLMNQFLPSHIKIIKPIIRPLSDMADNEAQEIIELVGWPQYTDVKLVLNRSMKTAEVNYNIQRIDYQVVQKIKHEGDKPIDCILHITSWGTINGYIHGEVCNNSKQINITHYLLSKGFDLFGLIPAGLAIDKTTLPNNK